MPAVVSFCGHSFEAKSPPDWEPLVCAVLVTSPTSLICPNGFKTRNSTAPAMIKAMVEIASEILPKVLDCMKAPPRTAIL